MSKRFYKDVLREALIEEMERDSNVFLLGEDIEVYGGAFRVTGADRYCHRSCDCRKETCIRDDVYGLDWSDS